MVPGLLEVTTPGDAEMPLNMEEHHTKTMLALYVSNIIKTKCNISCLVMAFPTPPNLFGTECTGSVSEFMRNKILSVDHRPH